MSKSEVMVSSVPANTDNTAAQVVAAWLQWDLARAEAHIREELRRFGISEAEAPERVVLELRVGVDLPRVRVLTDEERTVRAEREKRRRHQVSREEEFRRMIGRAEPDREWLRRNVLHLLRCVQVNDDVVNAMEPAQRVEFCRRAVDRWKDLYGTDE